METIKDILHVQSAEQDGRQELIASLLADPELLSFINEKKIPSDQVKARPYRFKEVMEARACCVDCKGLSFCKQKRTGYRQTLSFDTVLQDELETCPFRQSYDQSCAHMSHYIVNDLGKEMHTVNFEDIDLKNEHGAYLQALAQCMTACHTGKGLYLYGMMGTGKTYLAACAANYMAKMGKSVAFVRTSSFMERMRVSLRENEYRTEMNRLMYADLAVFDDIGAEEFNERTRSILLSILDDRLQNHRMTWFTSNHDFNTLQQHYILSYDGNNHLDAMRILERIKALTTTVEIIGNDRRTLAKING